MKKSLKIVSICSALGLGAIMMSGCTTAQKVSAGGGLAGGVAGAVIGNNWVPAGPTTGAVVGGSSGAAIGGLVGDAYDQVTEEDMARELENLRASLTEKEAELAGLRGTSPSQDQLAELEALRGQIGALENELAAARADNRNNDELQIQLNRAEDERDQLAKEINDLMRQKDILETDNQRLVEEAERLRGLVQGNEDLVSQLKQEKTSKEQALAELKKALQDREMKLSDLEGEVTTLKTSLNGKKEAIDELRGELANMNVELEETNRGLTMTIVNSLLYRPGSSDLSVGGSELLGKVAGILNEKFPNRELLIEGHTDNQPIIHSGWRSNWELGAARSLTILHELVNAHGMDPANISATSYGEFRPVSSNATAEGRRENRRAVIVILPEKLPVQRESLASAN